MQSSFDRALAAVLKHEGGYVDHPKDPGGATNKGITLANFRRYVKPGGTKADLKALTTEQAGVVYRRQYWDAVSGATLPAGVDYAVFDFGVNSGPSRAIKFLQGVVGAKADGAIGPKTLAAVAVVPADLIVEALCDKRLAWLKGLETWPTFGRGWAARIKGVRAVSLELAAEHPQPETITVTTPIGEPTVTVPDPPPSANRLWIVLGSIIAAIVAAAVNFFQQGA